MKPMNTTSAMIGNIVIASALLLLLSGKALACTTDAWGAVSGGVVNAETTARFDGDCGLRLDLAVVLPGWVEDLTPGTLGDVAEYVARFYVYVDDAQVADGNTVTLFSAEDAASSELFGLELKGSGGDMVFHIYAYDSSGLVGAASDVSAPSGWRAVALHWVTGASGSLELSIDDVPVQNIAGLDNTGDIAHKALLGAVDGSSSGISGVIDVDSFTSRRTGSAGLVSRNCSGAVVDNITFLSGIKSCDTPLALTFGDRVTFDPGAVVNVVAQTVTLTPGILIPAGAVLSIQ